MKLTGGKKSQFCKDNRSVVDLRFCLGLGTSAPASAKRATGGPPSSSVPAGTEHASTVAFTFPGSPAEFPAQCRALAANEPAGASDYASARGHAPRTNSA